MRSLLVGSALLVFAGLAVPTPEIAGQSVLIDEGTFDITRQGEPVGTEAFTIRRAGGGAETRIIATAEIELRMADGVRHVAPALETQGDSHSLSAYQVKVSGDLREEVYLTLSDRRFQSKVVSEAGEQVREFRATPGVLVLDEWVAHHHYFLLSRVDGSEMTVPVLVPRAGSQLEARISVVGSDRIQIGGVPVDARRIRVEVSGDARSVWLDSQGRVLQVEVPEIGYRAVRQALPG